MLIAGHLGMGCIGCGLVWGGIKGRSQDVFSLSLGFQMMMGLFPKFGMKSEHVTASCKAPSGPCTPAGITPTFVSPGLAGWTPCTALDSSQGPLLSLSCFPNTSPFLIHLTNIHLLGPRKPCWIFKTASCHTSTIHFSILLKLALWFSFSLWIGKICENRVYASFPSESLALAQCLAQNGTQ